VVVCIVKAHNEEEPPAWKAFFCVWGSLAGTLGTALTCFSVTNGIDVFLCYEQWECSGEWCGACMHTAMVRGMDAYSEPVSMRRRIQEDVLMREERRRRGDG
jgi:hypothetical protein